MSETVHYRGTAKRVDLQGLTNEEFAQNYLKENDYEIKSYYETALECLIDNFYDDFFFYARNKSLYQITKEDVDIDDEIITANFNGDKINYELRFYNGGAGFDECLEEAFDKIIK
jgi:hypothetical protein